MKANITSTATIIIMMVSCNSKIISLETSEVYKTQELGFSQANIVEGILFTSGQVGWDTDYKLTGDKSFNEQLKQTFVNLENILQKGNCTFDNVILIRFYVKDLNNSKRTEIGEIIKKYFPNTYKPNSTLIGVAELARKNLLVEIEIIAKIK